MVAGPNFLLNLTAIGVHYSLPMEPTSWHVCTMIPIVFISTVLGLRNLSNLMRDRLPKEAFIKISASLVLMASASFSYWFGPLPVSHGADSACNGASCFTVDESLVRSVDELKSLIPEEASLASSEYLGSQFTQRRILLPIRRRQLIWGQVPQIWEKADYILLSLNPEVEHPVYPVYEKLYNSLRESPEYELLYSENDIWLFRRRER